MADDPLVSVVIPVYNGANYLREAIDSVLKQTCHDYELIVVNDGSTDDGETEAIARSLGDRIRYFHKPNGGVASALNLGIQEMRGEWFCWLSHDDLASSNRVESDLEFLSHDHDVRILFCKTAEIDSSGHPLTEVQYPIHRVTNPRDALELGGVDFCSMTIHRSCFLRVGKFNERNLTMQDTEMSLRLASEYTFFFNENATSYRREHPSRGTHVSPDQKKRDQLLLCGTVHDELGIESFFPDLTDDSRSRAEAWMWMASFYGTFGAFQYAQESYRAAQVELGFWGRWLRNLGKTPGFSVRAMRRMYRWIVAQLRSWN